VYSMDSRLLPVPMAICSSVASPQSLSDPDAGGDEFLSCLTAGLFLSGVCLLT
jgi:hypothetical protein